MPMARGGADATVAPRRPVPRLLLHALHVKNLQWNSKTSNGNYYLKTQLIKMKFKP